MCAAGKARQLRASFLIFAVKTAIDSDAERAFRMCPKLIALTGLLGMIVPDLCFHS